MNERLIDLAIARLGEAERLELLRISESLVSGIGNYRDDGAVIGLMMGAGLSTACKTLAVMLNRAWRVATQTADVIERTAKVKELVALRNKLTCAKLTDDLEGSNTIVSKPLPSSDAPPTLEGAIVKVYELNVGRTPAPEEIEIWKRNFENGLPFHHFIVLMARSPEAVEHSSSGRILAGKSDGEFVQYVYELLYGRGCNARELLHWVSRIESGSMPREDVLAGIFSDAVRRAESGADQVLHDGLSCQIMGTTRLVTVEDWKARVDALRDEPCPPPDERYRHRFHIKSEPRFLVSAIASLYKGGDFIEQFMDNLTSQSCFDDYCELIIVDADSPENEAETIKRYLARHKGINYLRMNYCIGIYEAWNVGVKASRGEYLTNTNLDDLRRNDSLELQAGVLDNLPFVDVTYQDFYYTFDPRLSFDEIARFGYESDVPIVTPYNMMEFNSPHNAPMWRKRLHEELGYFNPHFKSAGDYEFWMRCLAAGKCFYKLNDPHVVYYQNPKGLSTRADTRGVVEANEIRKTYGRKLVSKNMVMPFQQFAKECVSLPTVLDSGRNDRYGLVQNSLRNLARSVKYQNEKGLAQ